MTVKNKTKRENLIYSLSLSLSLDSVLKNNAGFCLASSNKRGKIFHNIRIVQVY
jgi:hypothetical protein